MSTPIQNLLSRLENVKPNGGGWTGRCPAHDDNRSSLSVSEADGKVLVHCHAVCATTTVLAAVGLDVADLFAKTSDSKRANGKANIAATYDYRDTDGTLLYQAVRMQPKDFRQRRPNGGGWSWKLEDVERVPYRLPELIAADLSEPVFIVEGEKDADRLAELGLVSTCNAGGAGKWRDEYSEHLKGRRVVIIPDNDLAGQQHAEQVAQSLAGRARSVQITTLPNVPAKGDVSDWLGPFGDEKDMRRLAIIRRKRIATTGSTSSSKRPLIRPLADLITQYPQLRPAVIDGLLREGEVMNVIASPKVGKSWLAHNLAFSVATGREWLGRFPTRQGRVLLIDNELHQETLSHRTAKVAEAMSVDRAVADVDVLSLRGRVMSYEELDRVIADIEHGRYALVIVDAHYRMLPNTSENDNLEIMRVYNLLDRFAADTGAGWVLIHHTSKGDQSGKTVTDVGSGAGAQSRAADTHVILRKHEQDAAVVMDAVTRSFPPAEPVTLRWEPPLWLVDESLDPSKIETSQSRKQRETDDEGTAAIIDALQEGPKSCTKLRSVTGMGLTRCQRLLKKLKAEGLIAEDETMVKGNHSTVYNLAEA